MDPILIKAVRALVAAQQNAQAAGVALAPEDQDAFIREETKGKYDLSHAKKVLSGIDSGVNGENLTRSALQGVFADFGDEIVGALPEFLGGGEAQKEEFRLKQDLFRKNHGKADVLAGITGGLASSLLIPGAQMRGASLGKQIIRGAETGTAYGAAAGVGSGEGLKDRAQKGVVGAAVGGTLGAAIPEFAAVGKLALSSTARFARRMGNAIEHSGGTGKLKARVGEFESAGKGDEVMALDLSPELKQEADFAANSHDPTFINLERKLEGRQADQSGRLLADVEDVLGSLPDADLTRTRHSDKLARWAEGPDGWEGLRQSNPEFDPDNLAHILWQPKVRDAWAAAKANGLIGAHPEIEQLAAGKASFQNVQELKETLSDLTSAAFAAKKGNLGRRLKEAHTIVLRTLEETIPNYSKVNAKYARKKAVINLIEQGERQWAEMDSRPLRRLVATLRRDELTALRIGLASKLVARLNNVDLAAGEAARISKFGKSMQSKLQIIFGSEKRLNEFVRRVQLETDMGRSMSVVRGSQTARRLAAQNADPLEMADAVMGGPTAMATKGASMMLKSAKGAQGRRTAAKVGPVVATQGAPALRKLLDEWQRRPSILGPLPTRGLPAIGGLLSGRLF